MAAITKKDLIETLSEFYGKFIEPEFRAIRSNSMTMIKGLGI